MSFIDSFVQSLVTKATMAATDKMFGGAQSSRHRSAGTGSNRSSQAVLTDETPFRTKTLFGAEGATMVDELASEFARDTTSRDTFQFGGDLTDPLLRKLVSGETIKPTDFLT